jgi:hypothetical protein
MAKVLVSLDDRVLARLDEEARARKMSRSALLSEMATTQLGMRLGPGARPEVHEALRRLHELFDAHDWTGVEDSTATIRAMRDSR